MSVAPRVAPGGLRELGLVGHLVTRLVARSAAVETAHLFTTLGRQRRVFRGWLHFSATLLFGGLSRRDTELVILRVAHLRRCDYELDHHRRLARRAGLDDAAQARVFEGPAAPGWSPGERALLAAVDALVETRELPDAQWQALAALFDERQCLTAIMLIGQYDMLATTIGALRIARDVPLTSSCSPEP